MLKRMLTGLGLLGVVSIGLAAGFGDPDPVVVNRDINGQAHAAVDTMVEASRGHFNVKNVTLNTPPRVVEELTNGESGKALKFANPVGDTPLSVVAYQRIGVDSVILLISLNTSDGPALFHLCLYTYKGVTTLSDIGVTGDWTAMETAIQKIDRLPAPVAMYHNPDHTGETPQPPPQ